MYHIQVYMGKQMGWTLQGLTIGCMGPPASTSSSPSSPPQGIHRHAECFSEANPSIASFLHQFLHNRAGGQDLLCVCSWNSPYLKVVLEKTCVKRWTSQEVCPWDLKCACPSLMQSPRHRDPFLKRKRGCLGEGLVRLSLCPILQTWLRPWKSFQSKD